MRPEIQVTKNGMLGIISPHFDDAVFSVGGILSQIERPVKIITVCAGSPSASTPLSSWDERCGFNSPKEASIARRDEDYKACGKLKADSAYLSFEDFPYYGIKSTSEIMSKLKEYLYGVQEIWAPMGIGSHPDHVASRDAALRLATKLNIPIALYADAPYASARGWETPDDKREPAFQWGPSLREVSKQGFVLSSPNIQPLKDDIMLQKLAIASSYKSQLVGLKRHYPNITEVDGELSNEAIWYVEFP